MVAKLRAPLPRPRREPGRGVVRPDHGADLHARRRPAVAARATIEVRASSRRCDDRLQRCLGHHRRRALSDRDPVFSRNQRVQLRAQVAYVPPTRRRPWTAIREEFGLEDEPATCARRTARPFTGWSSTSCDMPAPRAPGCGRTDFLSCRPHRASLLRLSPPSPASCRSCCSAMATWRCSLANLIQVCLLFLVGFRWARHTGANPWFTGFAYRSASAPDWLPSRWHLFWR